MSCQHHRSTHPGSNWKLLLQRFFTLVDLDFLGHNKNIYWLITDFRPSPPVRPLRKIRGSVLSNPLIYKTRIHPCTITLTMPNCQSADRSPRTEYRHPGHYLWGYHYRPLLRLSDIRRFYANVLTATVSDAIYSLLSESTPGIAAVTSRWRHDPISTINS